MSYQAKSSVRHNETLVKTAQQDARMRLVDILLSADESLCRVGDSKARELMNDTRESGPGVLVAPGMWVTQSGAWGIEEEHTRSPAAINAAAAAARLGVAELNDRISGYMAGHDAGTAEYVAQWEAAVR